DSFEGLPPGQAADGPVPFAAGDLQASRETLAANFRRHGLRPPEIHAGWFQDTLPTRLPDRICFAHLDGDYYDSIMVSLAHVYPRLSPGAVCLIDDYHDPSFGPGWNLLPGVKKACDEFLADKPERVSMLYAAEYSHGYFRKQ
ncbi:MAG TPA: TylF/MycF/NovP-related O-methyltransferase, partial [Methylomirabilota bacterium]|nr:TylF/MycF/NovP-related O-methyltransferase [Methylomirabilota bacterium]